MPPVRDHSFRGRPQRGGPGRLRQAAGKAHIAGRIVILFSEDVAFADFDGDGDLDLVFVSEDDRTDELYLNDGAGRFTDASSRLSTHDVSNALAVLDLDADGAPDLLIGSIGTDRVLVNDGRGRFRDETAARWPQGRDSRTQDLELVDVDGDGDLDVAVGNEGQNQLYLNRDGRLVDETDSRLPKRADETRETRAADVDGDGDGKPDATASDIPLTDVSNGRSGGAAAQASDPGVPTQASEAADAGGAEAATQARAFDIQPIDVDRDGDVDVLVRRRWYMDAGAGNYLALLNDGSGRFEAAAPGTVLPATADGNGFDIEVADFNRDGIADLFLCNRASIPEPGAAASSGGRQRLLFGEARD